MDNNKMMGDYERTKQVILSCKNADQLKVAVRMYNQLNRLHSLPEKQLDKLENLIGLMRINFGLENIDEEVSIIGKEFKKAATSSGTPELKKIQFSESKKTLTEKEIAEKHDVDIEDIKKEISIGTKIEMEHTEDKKEARKIAMDHVKEDPKYYDKLSAAGLEELEEGQFCPQCLAEYIKECWDKPLEEAEYRGRKVTLGKPFLTPDGPKKRAVYVKNDKGNVVKVTFGLKGARVKNYDKARARSFQARHRCSDPGPRWKARYWSCRAW